MVKLLLSREAVGYWVTMKKAEEEGFTLYGNTCNGIKERDTNWHENYRKVASDCIQRQLKASTFEHDPCFRAGLPHAKPSCLGGLGLFAVVGF